MAHLWVPDCARTYREVQAEGDRFVPADAPSLQLHDAGACWVLTAPAGVRVNGRPVDLGLHVLADRDELFLPDGRRLFFSTEVLARVQALPAGEHAPACPRCKQSITAGSPAVLCPQCGLWHHQSEELPCWTYSDRCAACSQPTALDAGYQWTPEEL